NSLRGLSPPVSELRSIMRQFWIFVTLAFLDGRIDGVECVKLPMKVSANPSPSPSRSRNSTRPFYSPLDSFLNLQRWTTTFAESPPLRSCLSRMAHHR